MSESDLHNEISSSELIKSIVQDLFSYNTIKRKRILEYYFFQNASLCSPIMSTEGVDNIQYIYTVWQTLNRKEPTITNIVFDGHTAVIHLLHNISPTLMPSFFGVKVPAITTLYFRETITEECDGLLKIYRQEDSWTLEGLMQSMPLISFWYNNVLRVVMGKLMTTTGDILDSAVNHAQKMTLQSREIHQIGNNLAIENLEKLDEYRSDIKATYLEGIKSFQECYIDRDDVDDDDYAFTPIKESVNTFNER